jgi:hypothetical protein
MMKVQCDCFDCDVKCDNCEHSIVHEFYEECLKRFCPFSMTIVECIKVKEL